MRTDRNSTDSSFCLINQYSRIRWVFFPVGWLVSGAIALSGCVSESSPVVSEQPPPPPPVFPTEEDITSYAKAILVIEPIRRDVAIQVEQTTGSIPLFACNQPDTVGAVSKDIQDIVVNYCTQAKEIVENSPLSINYFNDITANLEFDTDTRQKIQDELIRQQQTSFTQ